jgi:integrase
VASLGISRRGPTDSEFDRPAGGRGSEAKAFEADEIARVLDAARGTRWHAFIALAFALGARRGELLALRWPVVDLERGVVRIEGSLSQTKGAVTMKGTKTDRVRTVPLSSFALEALRRQKAAQASDKLSAGASYRDEGFVFADPVGGCITPWNASYAFAELARKAGISSTRLHDARHTAATTMLVAGIDALSVAGMLGHSSAVTTMTVYAHLAEGAMVTAADRLGAAMERATERKADRRA